MCCAVSGQEVLQSRQSCLCGWVRQPIRAIMHVGAKVRATEERHSAAYLQGALLPRARNQLLVAHCMSALMPLATFATRSSLDAKRSNASGSIARSASRVTLTPSTVMGGIAAAAGTEGSVCAEGTVDACAEITAVTASLMAEAGEGACGGANEGEVATGLVASEESCKGGKGGSDAATVASTGEVAAGSNGSTARKAGDGFVGAAAAAARAAASRDDGAFSAASWATGVVSRAGAGAAAGFCFGAGIVTFGSAGLGGGCTLCTHTW